MYINDDCLECLLVNTEHGKIIKYLEIGVEQIVKRNFKANTMPYNCDVNKMEILKYNRFQSKDLNV